MRTERAFFKPRNQGVYLHICNHTVNLLNDFLPLGDLEKAMLIMFFEKYKVKYNIEIISLVIMGNHFHALIYCSEKKLTREQAFEAYNKTHKKTQAKSKDDYRVTSLRKHSNNISEFMREVQRAFSYWFNRSRPYKRRGALWQDRFQSQLVQSDLYLWICLKYIEMNPVRAGITNNAGNYKFSSFGRWQEQHPYQKEFMEHIVSLSGKKCSPLEFKEYMSRQMKIMQDNDTADKLYWDGKIKESQALRKKIAKIRNEEEELIWLFREDNWHRKKVIGSKEFLEQKKREWALYRSSA